MVDNLPCNGNNKKKHEHLTFMEKSVESVKTHRFQVNNKKNQMEKRK